MRVALLIISISFLSCYSKRSNTSGFELQTETIKAVLIDKGMFVGPCEPSISINPMDPENIVAGAILDRVYVSHDAGQNWTKERLVSPYGVYGDPVVRFDYEGNVYYSHLSNPNDKAFRDTAFLDRIVIQKSEDRGKSWNDGSYTLPRSPKDQDKQWMCVDPADNSLYLTWTEFDLYGSDSPDDRSRILFSKSIDQGTSWSFPFVLSEKEGNCLDDDQTTEGAVPCVGPAGQIYVSWSYDEKIYFDKSYDKGESWMDNDIIIAEQPGGWAYSIPGLMRCNGMPITRADRSNSDYRGNIYVNWTDQRNGSNDTDVWIARSSDEGESWSEAVRVNTDAPDRHQFLTWMDVDQTTGYIYIVFYDRRHHKDNKTDVYLAYSTDGGNTFSNIKINEKSFEPSETIFFGDYNDISVYEGRVRPIWTQLDNGQLSIWTALIN